MNSLINKEGRNHSLTPPTVDRPTVGQMPQASNFLAENGAVDGCRRARCALRSPASPAASCDSTCDAQTHSSASPRSSLSVRCHSSSPSNPWKCHTELLKLILIDLNTILGPRSEWESLWPIIPSDAHMRGLNDYFQTRVLFGTLRMAVCSQGIVAAAEYLQQPTQQA